MKAAVNDLRVLWATRKSSGFPWPFQPGLGWEDTAWRWFTGYSIFSSVPTWKILLRIPLRPYRYAKAVREIARVRNYGRGVYFDPRVYDDVP
jgi:hypothetical protein